MRQASVDSVSQGMMLRLRLILSHEDTPCSDARGMKFTMTSKYELQQVLDTATKNLAAFPMYFHNLASSFPTVNNNTILLGRVGHPRVTLRR